MAEWVDVEGYHLYDISTPLFETEDECITYAERLLNEDSKLDPEQDWDLDT